MRLNAERCLQLPFFKNYIIPKALAVGAIPEAPLGEAAQSFGLLETITAAHSSDDHDQHPLTGFRRRKLAGYIQNTLLHVPTITILKCHSKISTIWILVSWKS